MDLLRGTTSLALNLKENDWVITLRKKKQPLQRSPKMEHICSVVLSQYRNINICPCKTKEVYIGCYKSWEIYAFLILCLRKLKNIKDQNVHFENRK